MTVTFPTPLDASDTRWSPPLDGAALATVLARLRAWQPLSVEDIFDDLDTVIGDQSPLEAETPLVLNAMRDHLSRLSAIAVADPKFPPTETMVRLIGRGRLAHKERLPADPGRPSDLPGAPPSFSLIWSRS
ncbi:hypothetical protein ACGFZA_32630 [Streptomyces sp. NPDC048211]|uniref:hypothetical protein n=1 Tax=Streptomyces sp. NPDC048211 TaxID=3365516 RepID=UPI0037169744